MMVMIGNDGSQNNMRQVETGSSRCRYYTGSTHYPVPVLRPVLLWTSFLGLSLLINFWRMTCWRHIAWKRIKKMHLCGDVIFPWNMPICPHVHIVTISLQYGWDILMVNSSCGVQCSNNNNLTQRRGRHITSNHTTSIPPPPHHLTLPHTTNIHPTSPHTIPHHLTSHHITSHHPTTCTSHHTAGLTRDVKIWASFN